MGEILPLLIFESNSFTNVSHEATDTILSKLIIMDAESQVMPAAKNKTLKRELTPREKTAAANLKRIWDEKSKESVAAGGKRLFQKEVAAVLGVGQSMISQYLNGTTRIGTDAILRFASFLKVRPTDIDPEFEYSSLVPGQLPSDAIEIAVIWNSLPPPHKKSTRDLILSMGNDPGPEAASQP